MLISFLSICILLRGLAWLTQFPQQQRENAPKDIKAKGELSVYEFACSQTDPSIQRAPHARQLQGEEMMRSLTFVKEFLKLFVFFLQVT